MRSNQTSRQFKAIDSAEDLRRKREEQRVQIRKTQRDKSFQKKRNIDYTADPTSTSSPTQSPLSQSKPLPARSAHIQQKLLELPKWVAGLNSADPTLQFDGAQNIRKMLSVEKNPPISEVVASGVIPRLIQLLASVDYPKLQFEAAWALTNVASGSTEDTAIVVQNNAVPYFVELLKSPDTDVREQSTWALGNIAGENTELRDYVLKSHGMAGFIYSLQLTLATPSPPIGILKNTAWAISNLCRGKPEPDYPLVSPVLPTLLKLLHINLDDDLLSDVCWALSYLSDGENDKVQAVIDAGVIPRLAELLMHHSVGVKTPALRTIGNLVTGDDDQTEQVLKVNVLPSFLALLNSSKKNLRKETCWAISNITAGNKHQIQKVIDADLVPSLVRCLSDSDFETKKEACWAITNATSGGSKTQIQFLVAKGVLRPLCKLLTIQDAKLITVALDGLENILKNEQYTKTNISYADMIEEVDGVEFIEDLQTHNNAAIYEKAVMLLETYFNAQEEDTEQEGENSANNMFSTTTTTPGVVTNPAGQQTFSFNWEQPQPPSGAGGGFNFKF